ncbi:MAG TPA: glycosyltransferase family 39 protein [Anaerolineaceae bacterium]
MALDQRVVYIAGCLLLAIIADWQLILLWRRRKAKRLRASLMPAQSERQPSASLITRAAQRIPFLNLQAALPPEDNPDLEQISLGVGRPTFTVPSDWSKVDWRAIPGRLWRSFCACFAAPTEERAGLWIGARVGRKALLIEGALILFVTLVFCSGFLVFGHTALLPGHESEEFQSLDTIFRQSILQDHQLPLWNPYFFTGLPFVADPMFHSFNPIISIPVLILGVWDGFKVGLLISFMLGGLGMWYLAATLGLGPLARVWMALIFTLAGQPAARFIQGEYLFVLGWACLPWIIASLIAFTQTRRRVHAAVLAVFLGLLFLSGNGYYSFYIVLVIGLYLLVFWLCSLGKNHTWSGDARKAVMFISVGLLALGLVAVQLLPTIQLEPHIVKGYDLTGSQTPRQVLLDLLSTDTNRPDAIAILGAPEEFYAYIGFIPFLPLLFLPIAVGKRNRKMVLYCVALILFSIIYIDVRNMPWVNVYTSIPFLRQFRHPVRMIIFIEMAMLILAGYSIDALWARIWQGLHARAGEGRYSVRQGLHFLAGGILLGLALWSVRDVYTANQGMTKVTQREEKTYQVMSWMSAQNSSLVYVRHNPNNWGYQAAAESRIHLVNLWYPFADIRPADPANGQRRITPQPTYILQNAGETGLPDNAQQIGVVGDYAVYHLPDSLPYAFTVPDARLAAQPDGSGLSATEVSPQQAVSDGPNDLDLIVDGKAQDSLVLMVTNYPGWELTIDGHPQEITDRNGFLSTSTLPGIHQYHFEFRPSIFFVGLLISLLCLGVLVFILVGDTRAYWRPAAAQAREWVRSGGWRRIGENIQANRLFTSVAAPDGLDFSLAGLRFQVSRVKLEPWQAAALLGKILFGLTLVIYLVTHFWGLDRFPIYFFSDEAIQTTLAANLVQHQFTNDVGTFLPTFFKNVDKYNLGVSVYLQVIPYILFGKSVWVTRGISVLVSLLGVLAVSLTLKNIFKSRYWWIAGLFLSISPAWFLHSRTAFETVLMASFYAMFLYCYLMYRYHAAKYLYAALIFGALAFYAYSPGEVIMGATGLLLLISDGRYHLQQKKMWLKAGTLLVLLALPYIRFQIDYPGETGKNLQVLGSYWLSAGSLWDKLSIYLGNYLSGLNPLYWYLPNTQDLSRHLMKGYGHLLLVTLPFTLIGLYLAARRIKSSAYRTLLIAILVVPSGEALVGIGITRSLSLVIPVAILSGLGLSLILSWVEKHIHSYRVIAWAVFLILGLYNFQMLSDALRNGPLWYQDYGLYGMQYGGEQVFSAVADYEQAHPDAKISMSSSWANNADTLADFFLPNLDHVKMDSVDTYTFSYQTIDPDQVFVLTAPEYAQAEQSHKFKQIQVKEMIPDPNGQPGFYLASLAYVDNIQEIFKADEEARRVPVDEDIIVGGQTVHIRHSQLDMGKIQDAFDGDPNSLIRTLEANPMLLDLTFPVERTLKGVIVRAGSAATLVRVTLTAPGSADPLVFTNQQPNTNGNKDIRVDFGKALSAKEVRIEVQSTEEDQPAHVHVWEVQFQSGAGD